MFVTVFVLALALSVSAQYGQQVSLQLRFAKKAFSDARACCMPPRYDYGASVWNHLLQWWILL